MTPEEIQQVLAAKFGESVGALQPAKQDPWVLVKPEAIAEVCRFLKDDPRTRMDSLMNLTAVDWPKRNNIDVVYHLFSYAHRHVFVLKVQLDRAAPVVPSGEIVWKAADWLEREQFDLLGVQFTGHPDLRRVLLPDDWVGHPLRKDYSEAGGYQGISNVRDNPLDLYLNLARMGRAQQPAPAAPAPAPAPAAAAAKPAEPAKGA